MKDTQEYVGGKEAKRVWRCRVQLTSQAFDVFRFMQISVRVVPLSRFNSCLGRFLITAKLNKYEARPESGGKRQNA